MRSQGLLFGLVMLSLGGNCPALSSDSGEAINIEQYKTREILSDPTAKPCPETPITLTQVTGNLYRHSVGSPPAYTGFVLITKEGALVIDPAQTCTAIKLEKEIDVRFQVPVKYVIYSHAHFDHIAGSQIFQEKGALVVSHKNALEPILGEKLPTAVPNRVFERTMKIVLGGEEIDLRYLAPSHSNSLILIYFPKYKALQCTDICGSDSLPFNDFPDFYYDGWIENLKWVQTLDIDWVDDGHHSLATKQQQKALLEYLHDLHDQVMKLVRKGESWDEVYRQIKFKDSYKTWSGFENKRMLNILGMYRWTSTHRRGLW